MIWRILFNHYYLFSWIVDYNFKCTSQKQKVSYEYKDKIFQRLKNPNKRYEFEKE